jgi:hypothetical protein
MDAFVVVALCVIGVIAYVACAGVAYRMNRPSQEPCTGYYCSLNGARCEPCTSRETALLAAAFWPVAGFLVVTRIGVDLILVTPLRATFRLTAGLIGKERE